MGNTVDIDLYNTCLLILWNCILLFSRCIARARHRVTARPPRRTKELGLAHQAKPKATTTQRGVTVMMPVSLLLVQYVLPWQGPRLASGP